MDNHFLQQSFRWILSLSLNGWSLFVLVQTSLSSEACAELVSAVPCINQITSQPIKDEVFLDANSNSSPQLDYEIKTRRILRSVYNLKKK